MSPTTFTSILLQDLAPWLGSQSDPTGDHTKFLSALAQEFEQIFGLSADQGDPDLPTYQPGWGTLLNVQTCPTAFLPYLAQYTGAVIPAGTADAPARAIITAEAGQKRGTVTSISAAAVRNLKGTQMVIVQERTAANGLPDPYHMVVAVFTSELLTTLQDVTTAVEAVKPGGLQITYVASSGYVWSTAINTWAADTFTWQAAFTTQP